MVRRSPEANGIKESMTVIKYGHGMHDFLMETMSFYGICMLSRVVLGCLNGSPFQIALYIRVSVSPSLLQPQDDCFPLQCFA